MKYCSNCGAALVDGAASFCSKCGKPLPIQGDVRTEEKEAATAINEEPVQEKTVHKAPMVEVPLESADAICKKPKHKKEPPRWGKRSRRRQESKQAPADDQVITDAQAAGLPSPYDDGYDGYYEDVLSIDEGQRTVEKLDPDMIKKVVLVAGGALFLVIGAIVILLLM